MKHRTIIVYVWSLTLSILFFTSYAQVPHNVQPDGKDKTLKIAFYKGDDLYTATIASGENIFMGTKVKIKNNKLNNVSQIVSYPEQISDNIKIPKSMVFFQGLKSPHDEKWIYLERTINGSAYNLWHYSTITGKKEIIFTNLDSPDLKYAFNPIAWSESSDIIYFEAIEFDFANDHEGIWQYNITTGDAIKLNITNSYLTTPIISPDQTHFLYAATSNVPRDMIHGITDLLFVYNIKNKQENLMSKQKGAMHYPVGWTC